MKFSDSLRLAGLLALAAVALRAAPAANATAIPERIDLQTAVRYALDNNFTIRQARERIRQQEGVELEVRAQALPTVAATGAYSRNDREISTYAGDTDRAWNLSVTAKETLYAGGGVLAGIRNSKLLREAAVLELQGIINEQLLLVRTKYYSVLLARERIAVQEENVKLLEEQYKDAKNRFDAGAVSNFEVLRAEVSLANGRPPLIQARNDFRIAIEEFRQATGFTGGDAKDLSHLPVFEGTLSAAAHPETIALGDALNSASANRPELQRLGKLVNAGEEGLKIAHAGYLPTVQAYGSYAFARNTTSAAWDNRRDGWQVGLQANWNIFDGRATAGRVAQAKSKLNQTRLSVEDSTLAVQVEVRRTHSSLQEAWELVESTNKVAEQAAEALRLANVRYTAGTATQLDVLTSQVALTQARLNQVQSYYGYNVALASLHKAMGQADSYATP